MAVNNKSAAEQRARVILVVEDEWIIRMTVVDALRDEGWNVVEAADGVEALEFLQSGAIVDMIFTDVRMPGEVDGMALLAFAQRTVPHVPVIVTSGDFDPGSAMGAGATAFLVKPYPLGTLAALVSAKLPVVR
ncbi:response regulator [Sphingomonas hylomeconis]|uniref:Response regulator n=1 Tax=Sphingomonas hylomeconis TaxID=1395958 RepID=A0ABV7SSX3_9SPHN|nr:response regulator [Sphingomonas hylomeconis]